MSSSAGDTTPEPTRRPGLAGVQPAEPLKVVHGLLVVSHVLCRESPALLPLREMGLHPEGDTENKRSLGKKSRRFLTRQWKTKGQLPVQDSTGPERYARVSAPADKPQCWKCVCVCLCVCLLLGEEEEGAV